jgi:alpha-tubulin suppressor-like RCC1 family protein
MSGGYHVLALTADHKLLAWGLNDRGQCDVPDDLMLLRPMTILM